MKIHRLALRNYRGIDDVELAFADVGVTIVEGPNEVGKSSLAEAIGLVFDTADSSNASRIRALQPALRDVGTEVTVEASTGRYRFVLTKVWNRSRRTELELIEPERVHLRGREAHDKVQEMLNETLDRPLWDALRFLQGGGSQTDGVRFGDVVSLGHVLDAAAGAELAGDREGDLWSRIVAERERYWTPTGQPRVERSNLVSVIEHAELAVTEVSRELSAITAAVEEVEALHVEIAQSDTTAPARHRTVTDLVDQLEAIQTQQSELRLLEAEEATSRQVHDRAAESQQHRIALIAEVESAAAHVAEVDASLADRVPELERTLAHEAGQRSVLLAARTSAIEAEHLAAVRVADREYRRQEIEIGQLTERRDRVLAARETLATVEAELSRSQVDERLVEELEDAELEVARTHAAARVAGATVILRSSADTFVQIDDEMTAIYAGDSSELVVGERLALQIGDLEVSINAGLDARALADAAAVADATFHKLCRQGGVASVAEARRLAERRVAAIRDRDEAQRLARENLRDLTFEQITAKVEGHALRLSTYVEQRPSEPSLAATFEEAKAEAMTAEQLLLDARQRLRVAELAADGTATLAREAQIEHAELRATAEHARTAHRVAIDALERARSSIDDESLTEQLAATARDFDDASGARALAARRLVAKQPQEVEALLDNARQARDRALSRRVELDERRREVQAMLSAKGELGLHQQLDDARSAAERGRRELVRYDARAAAARRLFEAFDDARARARQRYVAPFRTRIEQLGRIVFGSSFEVALDEDLCVSTRTLEGVTLPLDHLSGGAKEQLDLISRLACAGIVSTDGGAPVIVDDALGWSDPARLESMGATIALAARDCQVIVLTCSPDRFASVGNARVVRFGAAQPLES